jgi:hypothetical protein
LDENKKLDKRIGGLDEAQLRYSIFVLLLQSAMEERDYKFSSRHGRDKVNKTPRKTLRLGSLASWREIKSAFPLLLRELFHAVTLVFTHHFL